MTDLIAFLNARLDEDEAAAQARRGIFPSPAVENSGAVWFRIKRGGNADLRAWADTDQCWTQDRVLREVAAKRRRLALYLDAKEALAAALKKAPPEDDPATAHSYVRERINVNSASGRFNALEMSVRLDVMVYSDHPDYRDEWNRELETRDAP